VLSRTDARTAVSGVETGQRVIVQGAGFLNEGDRVTVAPAPAQRQAAPAATPPATPPATAATPPAGK
jgi:hypothetical protein